MPASAFRSWSVAGRTWPEVDTCIPRGAWVAVSSDGERVIAYGAELRDVIDEARKKGEADPIIARVPETTSALLL